jgi:hypothetical protein
MPASASVQFFLNWAKERADEMDATLASLESRVDDVQATTRAQAHQFISDLRARRDAFLSGVGKQTSASEEAWERAKTQLETEWSGFENQVNKYIENFGKQSEQQRAVFEGLAAAQMSAWRSAAEKIRESASQFAAQRQGDVDATVKRMKADAAVAEEKLQKLMRGGAEPWSALNGALAETRAAFDRANQMARNAFK